MRNLGRITRSQDHQINLQNINSNRKHRRNIVSNTEREDRKASNYKQVKLKLFKMKQEMKDVQKIISLDRKMNITSQDRRIDKFKEKS